MTEFKIIRFMSGWAVKKRFLLLWDFIRYGDYWPDHGQEQQGKVIEFETRKKAEEFLTKSLWVKKEQIA